MPLSVDTITHHPLRRALSGTLESIFRWPLLNHDVNGVFRTTIRTAFIYTALITHQYKLFHAHNHQGRETREAAHLGAMVTGSPQLYLPRAARVDERTDTMGPEAEQAVAHPVDERAVVEEQVHRRQETHEGREQPQEAKALLYAVPSTEAHREDRQDREQDQEHETLHDLHRVRDARETKPRRRYQQVDAEQHGDTNPR